MLVLCKSQDDTKLVRTDIGKKTEMFFFPFITSTCTLIRNTTNADRCHTTQNTKTLEKSETVKGSRMNSIGKLKKVWENEV